MKKTLVALAAASAVSAFAQVTITGLLDAGPRISSLRGAAVTQITANNSATSNITFLGKDDLGGGLSANIRWELDIVPTQTAGMTQGTPTSPDNPNIANYGGNGYSFVGLTSATAGTINFGTINTATLDANGIGNPFGTAIGSGYKVVAIAATRYQQAFEYITPSMNGLTAKGLVAFKDDKQNLGATSAIPASASQQTTNGRDSVQEFSLKYSQGPINLIASNLRTTSYYSTSNNGAACNVAPTAVSTLSSTNNALGTAGNTCVDGANYTVNTIAGNYKVGSLTGYAWLQTQKQDSQATIYGSSGADPLNVVDRTAKGFGVTWESSPALKLHAAYRQIQRNSGETYVTNPTATNTTNGITAPQISGIGQVTKMTAFGADYALSKLSSVYVRYEAINDAAMLSNTLAVSGSGYSTSLTNNKITNLGAGLRVNF